MEQEQVDDPIEHVLHLEDSETKANGDWLLIHSGTCRLSTVRKGIQYMSPRFLILIK